MAKRLEAVTPESMARLEAYAWPGNIRELQNVIERSCVLSSGPMVEVVDELRTGGREESATTSQPPQQELIATLKDGERTHIKRALAATGGRVHGPDGAAALLGINASTLRSRMKKLGIAKSST